MTKPLRAGDAVVVRGAREILATLDADGTHENMPFMPEMLPSLGRRLLVSKVAQKVCDTIQYTGSRQLKKTVLLEELRCDGSAHDGCQAECRFYWKEAWLRRAGPGEPTETSAGTPEELQALREYLAPHVRRVRDVEGVHTELYRCQATDVLLCTRRYRLWEPGQYINELTTGNVTPARWFQVMARAVAWESKRKLGFLPEVHLMGTDGGTEPPPLNLQPGEWVQVKSREEIRQHLNRRGFNRGLWFDWEMERYCGGRYQVRSRVNRFIDDRNSKMVVLKTDAVVLEGVACTGNYSARRWFCPRNVYPYWRESWLRRVDGPSARAAGPSAPPPAQPAPER